jgi:hypothetical protein
MPLVTSCPRCSSEVDVDDGLSRCPVHGQLARPLWRPDNDLEVTYEA